MKRDYTPILNSIKNILEGEPDVVANLANVAAILKTLPEFFWVGFYLVKGKELVLGPFQGPVACTRIAFGKGVCGTAWAEKKSIVVPDVNKFEGHIACNSNSKSEIVVPVFNHREEVVFILDADSDSLNAFDENDREALEQTARFITQSLKVTA